MEGGRSCPFSFKNQIEFSGKITDVRDCGANEKVLFDILSSAHFFVLYISKNGSNLPEIFFSLWNFS